MKVSAAPLSLRLFFFVHNVRGFVGAEFPLLKRVFSENRPCLAALLLSPSSSFSLLPFVFFFFLSTAHLKSRAIKRKNLDQAFKHCSVICPPRKVFYASPLLPSVFPPALGLYTSLCLLNALMHDGLNLIDVQRASARAPLACARTHVREWWIEHVWSPWLDFIRVFSSPSFFNILCFYTYISISRSDLTRFHLSLSFYSHPQRGMC